MRITSVTANYHRFAGAISAAPLRFWFTLEDGRAFGVAGASDGASIILDRALDEPFSMDEAGEVLLVDVTQSVLLSGSDEPLEDIRFLDWSSQHVGVRLGCRDGSVIYIWNADDELKWGDENALHQSWPDRTRPSVGDGVGL
ncbi:MAG: hypothetical protein EOP17_00210 [Rhizobiaceae bacterium]|nr:MAG: hypothetical protein EOP17_00210 [Rhizobiaceae bacterium]